MVTSLMLLHTALHTHTHIYRHTGSHSDTQTQTKSIYTVSLTRQIYIIILNVFPSPACRPDDASSEAVPPTRLSETNQSRSGFPLNAFVHTSPLGVDCPPPPHTHGCLIYSMMMGGQGGLLSQVHPAVNSWEHTLSYREV